MMEAHPKRKRVLEGTVLDGREYRLELARVEIDELSVPLISRAVRNQVERREARLCTFTAAAYVRELNSSIKSQSSTQSSRAP